MSKQKELLLDKIKFNHSSSINYQEYPFSLKLIKNLKEIKFKTQITFFVGKNGTGKSTILESIAGNIGFGPEGGSKNIAFKTSYNHTYSGTEALSDNMILSWIQKPKDGYFFRAESFYNVANYLEYLDRECGGKAHKPYGSKPLHSQSHGESFLSFFKNRMYNNGFFILDEPEAALSPQRQLSLLVLINEICQKTNSQFIIATHSPILLSYPNMQIFSFDNQNLEEIKYKETNHFRITKDFLNNPQMYLKKLFSN